MSNVQSPLEFIRYSQEYPQEYANYSSDDDDDDSGGGIFTTLIIIIGIIILIVWAMASGLLGGGVAGLIGTAVQLATLPLKLGIKGATKAYDAIAGTKTGKAIGSGATTAVDWTKGAGTDAVDWSKGAGTDAVDWSKGAGTDAVDWSKGAVGSIGSGATDAWDSTLGSSALGNLGSGALGGASDVFGKAGGVAGGIISGAGGVLGSVGSAFGL